jgi:hypothetical protein
MTTRVVNIRVEPCDVYIGRGSIWGNPFSVKASRFRDVVYVATLEEALLRYREHLSSKPELLAKLEGLRGKRLGCFCRPRGGFLGKVLCHGQILVSMIEGIPPESVP